MNATMAHIREDVPSVEGLECRTPTTARSVLSVRKM